MCIQLPGQQDMNFHFKLERARGGYLFDLDNNLKPTTWIDGNPTEPVEIDGVEIHKTFVLILNPFHDFVKKNNIKKDMDGNFPYKKIFDYINQDSKKYDRDLVIQIKTKIIEFANEYGFGGYEDIEHINPDYTLEGFSIRSEAPNLINIVEKAIDMTEMLLARTSYEVIPKRLKDICNLYSMFLKPQLNGGLHMETSSIFATMFWTMAFTEYTHKIKECKYCQSPILTDIRANFCLKPRQCKNNFNNAKRTKKGTK